MKFLRILLLLFPLNGLAQNIIRFPSEILSSQKSSDQSMVAITTIDSVYIIDINSFVITKKWKHNELYPIVVGFHPYNNNVLLLQRNNINAGNIPGMSDFDRLKYYYSSQKTWSESPLDSLTLWDITNSKLLRTVTGSFYIQFGKKDGEYAGVMNQVYSYQYQGGTNYSARSSDLNTSDGETVKTTRIGKACRRLLMDKQRRNLAISWYDEYINNQSVYSFSVMNFLDHRQVFAIDSLPELVTDYCFSPSGEKLAIYANFTKDKEKLLRIYEVSNGKLVSEIRNGGNQLQFSDDNKFVQYRNENGEWIQWDLEQNKNTQKVWSGLTSLWSLDNILSIKDKLIISGISWSNLPMASEKRYQLEKINLADLKLFSSINDPVVSQLTDSTTFSMQFNDISENARLGRPEIRFNKDRTVLTSTQENQLQIWNTETHKKILQKNFPKSIRAFPDKTGNNIMIVEDNGQQSYSEYRMHLISLKENTMYSSGPILNTDSTLDGSSNKCNCQSDETIEKTWSCTDRSGTIWKVSGNNLVQKAILKIPDFSIFNWEYSGDGIVWLSGKNKNEERLLWKADLLKGTSTFIQKLTTDHFFPEDKGYWTWNSQDDSTASYWEDGKLISAVKFSGKIIKMEPYASGKELFVQFEKNSYQYWQIIKAHKDSMPAHRTEWINARLYVLKDKTILSEEKNLHSIVNEGAFTITWSIPSPLILQNTNFDISTSGRYLLIGNHVIDLKEIAQWNINKYNPTLLLQDTGSLKWVELISDKDYSGRKGAFSLIRLEKNGRDTVFARKWFRAENVDPFAYIHEDIISSPDKRWVITSPKTGKGKNSPPVLWDIQTMEGKAIGTGKENQTAYFSEDGNTIIVSSYKLLPNAVEKNETIEYYSIQPLMKIKQFQRVVSLDAMVPDRKDLYKIINRNVEWYENLNDSLQLKRRYFSRDYLEYVTYHKSSDIIAAGTYSGSIHFWERKGAASPVTTLNAHKAAIVRMETRGDRLFTLGADGSITITSIPDKKILVHIITLQNGEGIRMAFYTPEGYYKADPALTSSLHFVKNGSVYPLSSFEYQGNRPDKVYGAMGFSDPGFISLLKQSWETRLKRAGIKAEERPILPTNPVIEWDRKNIPVLVRDSIFNLSLRIHDNQTTTNTLFVRINGVPEGPMKGVAIQSSATPSMQQFPLRLNEGKNRISVSALNAKGNESVEQEFEIYYQPKEKKTVRVFYAGIGVSSYLDSNYNLRYAAKDVKDISERLGSYFDSVFSYTLTNEKASKKNILALHEWLKKTSTNDIVILSLSGHGLIETGKGFFFAPHEMNFSEPSQSGITMSDLESILDDIPARRRLLLIDACHSGEEWSDTTQINALPPGVSITRGGKIKSTVNTTSDTKRQSFLLMKEIFSDLSRGNGAFMISAAGSTEFAYEGKVWNNGVFTRSFLESLHELRYRDSFKGPLPIRVSDLRKLIYEKVRTVTRGMQNPTSRQENGWWDWEL